MSILRKLQLAMMGFGLSMGLIFPVYANFFVDFKPGLEGYFNLGALLAGLTVGLVNHWFLRHLLIKHLRKIQDFAIGLGEGKLNSQIDLQSKDSIGEIATSLNTGISELKKFLTEVVGLVELNNSTSLKVQNHLNELQLNSLSLTESMSNVGDSIDKVQFRIQSINTESNELSKQLDSTGNRIDLIYQQINNVTQLSSQAQNETLQSIDQVHDLQRDMQEIKQLSQGMNEIILTIEEVAEQTQLLSLNASIEAASAGEKGLGFAIVASEIKNLARSTNKSTQKIQLQIEQLQKSTQDAEVNLGKNSLQIKANQNLFITLNDSIQKQSEILKEILADLTQGKKFSQHLASHVTKVNQETHIIQKCIHQVSKNLDEFLEHIQNISTDTELMTQSSKQVSKNLASFET